MKKKTIQEEIERDTEKMFKQLDKVVEKQWGKMCPQFEPDCVQCRFHLTYNKFKDEIWQWHVRDGKGTEKCNGGIKMKKAEKILEKFVVQHKLAKLGGSGDDEFYTKQIQDYVNKQKQFLVALVKFTLLKSKEAQK